MSVRIASSKNTTIVTSALLNTVEAIIFSVGPIGLIQDNAQVLLHWMLQLVIPAGAVSFRPRIRRGAAVTSTEITTSAVLTVTASTTIMLSGSYVDSPGVSAGLQYVLTGLNASGGNNVTVSDGCFAAYVL